MSVETNYNKLINKIDAFIRKYYKNMILRGLIYTLALVTAFYLFVTLFEHFARFGSGTRTVLFYSLVLGSSYLIVRFVLIPIFKLFKLGKTISYEQASKIIGDHFGNVEDKLLNTLQLKKLGSNTSGDISLINASIDQKISELNPIPFSNAIDLGENRKYLKFALPPLGVFLILLFAAPSILKDSTNRLVNHNQHFEIEAPFKFIILNEDMKVPEQDDFKLEVKLEGDVFPDNLYIYYNNSRYKLNKENNVAFNYTFKNVQDDINFHLSDDEFDSQIYRLDALPKPTLLNFKVALDYPSYTGKKDESLKNIGNLIVPAGTKASWEFNTENTEELLLYYKDSIYVPKQSDLQKYSFADRLFKSNDYAVTTKNSFIDNSDSLVYQINVIPDLYPGIDVEEKRDSVLDKNIYFSGVVDDDYGFSKLTFNYRLVSSENEISADGEAYSEILPVSKNGNKDQFFHFWNIAETNVRPGDRIEYYFEVWDNDGVSGPKSSRSKTETYNAPSLEEIEDAQEKSNEEIKDNLKEGVKEAKELQKEFEELRKELLEKNELNWQERKKIENLLEKQKDLEKRMEDAKSLNEKNNQQKQENNQSSDQLMEKQRQLQELFDQVMSPEMKEMYRQMEELMKEMDKDEIMKQIEKMELSNEDIEAEMDRTLELFKQLELEQKVEEITDKLEELAKKQEELSEESKDKEADKDELKEKQEELNKEFEKLKEELDEMNEMNEELEDPNDLGDTEEMEEEIEEEMENSSEQLDKNQKNKASDSQKNASQKMQEMADQLSSSMAAEESESQQEDMEALRALLENIIELSFDQEEVMNNLVKVKSNDPKYNDYAKEQRKLKDDAQVVKDSLRALAKRVPELQSVVNKEINSVNANMNKAIDMLAERLTSDANAKQQYVMTSLNNLALILDDVLQQMQQQAASSMPGQGNCQKPGGSGQGKSSMKNMRQMQQALSKRLEKMKKDGQKPGKTGSGRNRMSEDIAKMAAEQGAIRRELEKMADELNKDGSGNGNELRKIAKEMEEQEKDLVNFELDQELIQRQHEILIKMLESEKAEKERDQENKRRSEEAKDWELSNPSEYFEYQKKKENELELLKTVPLNLKPYYKNKVNEYFINFEF